MPTEPAQPPRVASFGSSVPNSSIRSLTTWPPSQGVALVLAASSSRDMRLGCVVSEVLSPPATPSSRASRLHDARSPAGVVAPGSVPGGSFSPFQVRSSQKALGFLQPLDPSRVVQADDTKRLRPLASGDSGKEFSEAQAEASSTPATTNPELSSPMVEGAAEQPVKPAAVALVEETGPAALVGPPAGDIASASLQSVAAESSPDPSSDVKLRAPPLAGCCLHMFVAPGDVMVVKGSGGLMRIGAAGGFMGHVMLVVATPRRVSRQSDQAHEFSHVWPRGGVEELWLVRTIESTRREAGLYEAEMILYIETISRQIFLCGEVERDGEICQSEEAEPVEIWQSPEEPRSHLRLEIMAQVIAEMRACQKNWSATTAARAVMMRAAIPADAQDPKQIMLEIRECWSREPICTSVAISFWQRYFCKLAKEPRPGKAWVEALSSLEALAYDFILKYMPIKADRGLPGELIATMQASGWVVIEKVPRIFQLPHIAKDQAYSISTCHEVSPIEHASRVLGLSLSDI